MGPKRGSTKRKAPEVIRGKGEEQDHPSADWWEAFSKHIAAGSLKLSEDLDSFESIFGISRRTFDYICSLVWEHMISKKSNFAFRDGKELSIPDRVALAIRRLGSGDSFIKMGNDFGINDSAVSAITWKFIEAMESKALCHIGWPSSEELNGIKSRFESIAGLPNCCASIDFTHISMSLPAANSTNPIWLDHENNYSMTLLAVADSSMRFIDIVAGWPGHLTDSEVLHKSIFFGMCEEGTKLNGEEMLLSDGATAREYVIGDVGFPLLPWLITPYQGTDLTDCQWEFNKRHAAIRMVAQRALTRLKDAWKIIQREMWRPNRDRLSRIILVCCIMHNIIIDMEDHEAQDHMTLSHHHDVDYKQLLSDEAEDEGIALRDKLAKYLSKLAP